MRGRQICNHACTRGRSHRIRSQQRDPKRQKAQLPRGLEACSPPWPSVVCVGRTRLGLGAMVAHSEEGRKGGSGCEWGSVWLRQEGWGRLECEERALMTGPRPGPVAQGWPGN